MSRRNSVMEEGGVSDEDYLVKKARESWDRDPNVAKAWLLSAKSLFKHSFHVQFEAYLLEKEAKNHTEAARCFDAVLTNFPLEGVLWKEVQDITSALRTDSGDATNQFYLSLFTNLPSETQYQLLLKASDHSEDTMEHCRLLLLLLEKFPNYISQHGSKLVDTLLAAEKHSHLSTPGNPYRQLLVCELLPLLLKQPLVDIPPKQLYRLLQKAIEFHLSSIMDPASSTVYNEGSNACGSTPSEPWASLFGLLESAGRYLGWQPFQPLGPGGIEQLGGRLATLGKTPVVPGGQEDATKQLLYQASVTFLYCLHEYAAATDPSSAPSSSQLTGGGDRTALVLVEVFDAELPASDHKCVKKRKLDDDDLILSPKSHKTGSSGSAGGTGGGGSGQSLVRSFQTAVKCWELLHSSITLDREFTRLMTQLRSDSWPWLQTFLVDFFTYQGHFSEAVTQLNQAGTPSDGATAAQCKRALRLGTLKYALGDRIGACEQILQVVAHLPPPGVSPAPATVSLPPSSSEQRRLQFIPFTHAPVLHHCIRLLTHGLKARVLSDEPPDDLSIGHLMTLLQLDWPKEESSFLRLAELISHHASFSYPQFSRYIVNPDMLEELAYLASDQGGSVALELFPNAGMAQWNRERRISTRGVEKGSRDDLRSFLRRQMGRVGEQLDATFIKFFVAEGSTIAL